MPGESRGGDESWFGPPRVGACVGSQVRAGATLLFDSEPELEEAETELKASALIDAVTRSDPPPGASGSEVRLRQNGDVLHVRGAFAGASHGKWEFLGRLRKLFLPGGGRGKGRVSSWVRRIIRFLSVLCAAAPEVPWALLEVVLAVAPSCRVPVSSGAVSQSSPTSETRG